MRFFIVILQTIGANISSDLTAFWPALLSSHELPNLSSNIKTEQEAYAAANSTADLKHVSDDV